MAVFVLPDAQQDFRIHGDLYVYLIASHKQDFPTLWTQRLQRI